MSSTKYSKSSNLIGGAVLIFIGLLFLAGNMGLSIPFPNIGMFWPIFPMLGGLAFIGMFLSSREEGLLIPGVSAFLIGIFFFFFTFGIFEWGSMGKLWPMFPLIGGISFIAAWLGGGMREGGLLIPAGLSIGVGIIGLFSTVVLSSFGFLLRFWPVVLIIIGVLTLLKNRKSS